MLRILLRRLNELHSQYEEEVTKLKSMVGEAEYEAFTLLLERIRSKKFHELREKQTNKLIKFYGSPILMKERNDSFVNLSNETIDANIKEVFSYGMNCHLKTKFDKTKRKVELELFYENVKDKVRSKAITIENEDNF